jgi:cytochrome c-type biogenesis protein CcmH
MMRRATVLAVLCMLLFPGAAPAVEPGEMLKDPALEARAREIGRELRCLVCQNQSIDDSNAPLAHDLRVLVRERLTAGDTDFQVVDFVVARYGDFVLLKPPFKASTWVLWLATPLVLVLGGGGLVLWFRRRANAAGPAPLSADEERRLAALMDGGDRR